MGNLVLNVVNSTLCSKVNKHLFEGLKLFPHHSNFGPIYLPRLSYLVFILNISSPQSVLHPINFIPNRNDSKSVLQTNQNFNT